MSPYYSEIRAAIGQSLLLMPSVAAIVHNSDGDLLLQEKADGTWSLPAGAIEPGETAEDAVRRELLEETQLDAGVVSLVGCYSGSEFRHTYPNGDQVEYVVVLFHCHVNGTRNSLRDSETLSLRYFSRRDFPGLQLPYPVAVLYDTESAEQAGRGFSSF